MSRHVIHTLVVVNSHLTAANKAAMHESSEASIRCAAAVVISVARCNAQSVLPYRGRGITVWLLLMSRLDLAQPRAPLSGFQQR